jgi:hypothetical protein
VHTSPSFDHPHRINLGLLLARHTYMRNISFFILNLLKLLSPSRIATGISQGPCEPWSPSGPNPLGETFLALAQTPGPLPNTQTSSPHLIIPSQSRYDAWWQKRAPRNWGPPLRATVRPTRSIDLTNLCEPRARSTDLGTRGNLDPNMSSRGGPESP